MIGAHPELKGALEYNKRNKEKEENSPNNAPNEPKQQEIDTNKDVTCPKCAKIFFSKKNVKRHLKTQHLNLIRIKCNDCSRTFASKAAVNYHVKKCHAINSSFTCDTCDETFMSYNDFNKTSVESVQLGKTLDL